MGQCRVDRESGAAAIELAILLPIMFMMLAIPIYWGVYFYNYTIVQKAASHSARYMSTIPLHEMKSPVLVKAARTVTEEMADEMSAGLIGEDITIDIDCDADPCVGGNGPPPKLIKVIVTLRLSDVFFGVVSTGWWGHTITARVEVPYIGS